MAPSSLLTEYSQFTPWGAVTWHLWEATGEARSHALHVVLYLNVKEPELPSDWAGPKCQLLQPGKLDGVHAEGKAGPHSEETQVAGLDDEARAEAGLAIEQEGSGGNESVREDA